ncbi:oleate hydratase [Marinobacter vulgaris]|uniref:Oleate hydratase n=1 Tax=Marinobacter vulgaris TaxID=1928331 RepID=A0A2V3ZN65_9GAMM|nr:oleate hydratase [Marinobacter vulgaris]PXX92549.1 oleate hydratase [Marinobacter vulgaris]TSJ71508.1 oleate hydratase [Marinobacter vulgaris]
MARSDIPGTEPSKLKAHIDALEAQGVGVTPDASSRHLHNGTDTPLPPADLHGAYVNHRPLPTEGIADRRAWIVGSGIAGLSAAFFLIRDGHMPAGNITFLEEQAIEGGSLDGAGNAEDGYIVRGGREMEMTYQNFWDVFSEIPALELPEPFTVLDEYRIVNDADKNWSKARLLEKQGQIRDFSTMELTKRQQLEVVRLLLARKEDLDDITVEQWFSEGFLNSNFYTFWRTMFAFQNWHSVLEMKLYMHRFLHLMDGLNDMTSLVFPKYNQYDAFVRPLMDWLKDQGVNIQYDTIVENLEMETSGDTRTVTAIQCHGSEGDKTFNVGERDLVFITTGSMTEDTAYGDDDTAPELKENQEAGPGSGWQLWKNLAQKSDVFGRPEKFCGNIPGSTWESVTLTCRPSPLMDKLRELSVNDPYSGFTATGGIITFTDSAWLMSFTCNRQPHFPDQPDDVIVLWTYALMMDRPGDYVKKPMPECTGKEVLAEMCHHLGLIDQLDEVMAATKTRIALMPYITAQFMPRAKGDRPWVVPQGCSNLACMGQFVETHNDVVFTLESSVRTARVGVYSLLGINKQVPDIYPGQYDIRRLLRATRTLNNDEAFLGEGFLRRILGGTYFEHILPLGPDEKAEELSRPGLFEQQVQAVRGLVEDNHKLEEARDWVQGVLSKLRGRR